VSFSEQPPSKQWLALKRGEKKLAEVWFKPESEPFGLAFRIPRESLQILGMGQQWTMENLLKAVAIAPEEVESWRQGDVSHAGMNGSNPELRSPLPPPPRHVTQVEIYVRLKPPPAPQAAAHNESSEPEIPCPADSGPDNEPAAAGTESSAPDISLDRWQELEARWKALLVLEVAIDTVRISMEGLLAEMEGALTRALTMEEKVHAPRADVAQWSKAKDRIRFALPKMKDFIHRATWIAGAPERKRLEELYKDHIEPHVPFPQLHEVLKQLDDLIKDRQVLSAQGQTVYNSSKGVSTDFQVSARTLHSNAADNARKKKNSSR
jgi:hypothetical protein